MTPPLTPSLEDYLETIYLLQKGKNEARVRDIATARGVKASSVSPALKRLSEMGLLAYVQRESIQLTEEGKIAARRVYAKHILLFQFFHDILGMDAEKAREEARILYVAMTRSIRSFSWIEIQGKQNLSWQNLIETEV